jgi:parallel beta-helix repeat protein
MMRRIATLFTLLAAYKGECAPCMLPADHSQYVDITLCGASAGNSDNKPFIDAALSAAANGYQGIYIPAGEFLTSGNHIPPANVGIFGNGTLKLTSASTNPIIDTAHSGNKISGISFDLSASGAASRVAIDIDGGSIGTLVSDVAINYGRIIAYVTNGGSPPTQIAIRNSQLTSGITGGTSGGAIDINSGASHFSVVGNRVNGNWSGKKPIQKPGDGAGISVESGASYGQILQNDSYANTGSGIYILSGSNISVVNNNCSENRQSGIGINSNVIPRPGHLSITGNICNQNRYDGIDVNEAGPLKYINVSIQGNYLSSNGPPPGGGGTGIVLAYAANVSISSNTITDNSVAGIWLDSSQNIAVTGNIVSGNSRTASGNYPGLLLIKSSRNSVSGNIFTNDDGTGRQGFGIEERDSTSDYNIYTGNHTENNSKGAMRLLGVHDIQLGNL